MSRPRADGSWASIGKGLRNKIYDRDDGRCTVCHKELEIDSASTQVDHIIPFLLGGDESEHNLRLICRKCNMKRNGYAKQCYGRIEQEIKNKVYADIMNEVEKKLLKKEEEERKRKGEDKATLDFLREDRDFWKERCDEWAKQCDIWTGLYEEKNKLLKVWAENPSARRWELSSLSTK